MTCHSVLVHSGENRATQKQEPAHIKITICQLEALLTIVINVGLIQVPDIESYWSTNWISSIPFFSHLYAHEPFEQIFWMLHVSHGDPGGEEKRIDKVKIVLDLLVE